MKQVLFALMAVPLAACATANSPLSHVVSALDPTQPTTRGLSTSMPEAVRPAGGELRSMTVTSLLDGAVTDFRIQSFGNGIRVHESNGCIWTRQLDWFSPSDSWANCGTSRNWHTAQASVRELDPLYPLRVGSVGRYERSATSHTGRSYTRETRCEVTGAVEVLRDGHAATPAYVVACDDGRRLRTTWYAPGEGPVAYREVHNKQGLQEAWVRN